MSAPSITDATVEYQNIASAEQVARRTELKVDKQEQTITGIIEQNSEFESKLTQVTQDVDGIKQEVSNSAIYKRDVSGITEIKLEESAPTEILSLEIVGNKTYEANSFPAEDLYPSEELYPNQEVL